MSSHPFKARMAEAPQTTDEEPLRVRQQRFREEFIAGVPSWYRGEAQVAILLLLPAGTIYYCLNQIAGATWIEWSLIAPILLLGNFIEWAAHRYLLHGKVKGFELAFWRHAGAGARPKVLQQRLDLNLPVGQGQFLHLFTGLRQVAVNAGRVARTNALQKRIGPRAEAGILPIPPVNLIVP